MQYLNILESSCKIIIVLIPFLDIFVKQFLTFVWIF